MGKSERAGLRRKARLRERESGCRLLNSSSMRYLYGSTGRR